MDQLFRMPYTCSLDVVDDFGWYEQQPIDLVAWLIGVTRSQASLDIARAQRRARAAARANGMEETL